MDFLKHRNVERYARDILAFDYKHRRTPTREEAFRDCAVPVEFIDQTFEYIRKKETLKLDDLKPQELADYERASANVIKFCLRHKPHTDDVSVSLPELLFHFPDTSIPRAKRILEYLRLVDRLKLEPELPLRPEMEKAVRAALELPPGQRTISDISRRLNGGILTSKKVKAVLDHLAKEEADLGDKEVAMESMRTGRRPQREKEAEAEDGEGAEGEGEEAGEGPVIEAPRIEVPPPTPPRPAEPLVCSVCHKNPPTIRHFDCGEFVCDECIRMANATRAMSRHKETVCPKCKMPIIEGSTDAVL
jgi:hypothetical protein